MNLPPDAPPPATLIEAMPMPVIGLDGENRVTLANPAAEQWFGAARERLKGRPLGELAPPASPLIQLVAHARQKGGSVTEYGIELAPGRQGRSEKLADIYVSALPEPTDGLLLVIQPRAMIDKMKSQLTHRDAVRSVGAMAAMLAHEIKNPLSGIRGAAQLVEHSLPAEEKPLTALIRAEVDRIVRLVERFEVFSDERPLATEPVNLHEVLDHVAQLAISGFAGHIAFEKRFDPSLPPILGNRDRLVQALLNLVKNAAEAIGPEASDGRITLVTAFRPGVSVVVPTSGKRLSLPFELSIFDNGGGIPDHLAGHLFEPFVTTKASGTGLGLALVAKVVRDHGGVIEHEAVEQGTVFRILLPLHREKPLAGDGAGLR